MNGGTLGGTGTVGSSGSATTIEDGGTLAPGNSIGTLNVAGDLTFLAGSFFDVETDDSNGLADSVNVTGTATLAGTVRVDAYDGDFETGNGYTILAADSLVGRFEDEVMHNYAFLVPTLNYDEDASEVHLTLERAAAPEDPGEPGEPGDPGDPSDPDDPSDPGDPGDPSDPGDPGDPGDPSDPGDPGDPMRFRDAASTPNQIATADGVESLGEGNDVFDAVLHLPEDVVGLAFDALSGELHASARTALIEDSRFVRNAANDRIRAAFATVGASDAPVLAYGPGETPLLVAADHGGPVVWSHGFGSWGSTDSDGNAASFDRTTGGVLVGADTMVGDWRVGMLGGYSHSRFDADDRASSGSSSNYHLGLYGGTEWGNLAFRTGAAYSWHEIDTSRSVSIPRLTDSLTGNYSAGTFQAFGVLGYGIELGGGTQLEPFANLAHVSVHTDSFAEQGGAAVLSVDSGSTNVTFTTLGLRGEHAMTLGTMDATLRGTVGWRHAFGDTTPESTHAFSGGDAFTIAGVPIAGDAAVIEAGLDLNLTPDATFGLSYQGQIASDAQDHGFKADLSVRF
ncbi:autotransporter domain-containing protein [Pelagibacterium sp. H642]|nr:autotransporter domain-containing protein [Pelagibacterium sp. H642]